MRVVSRLRPLLSIGLLSLLAACSILPSSEPPQVYLLPSQSAPASTAAAVSHRSPARPGTGFAPACGRSNANMKANQQA